ncbi:DUF1828 domain-containing protein [Haemophilus haemolyticus]|jgi:hypothetical protein|uniref:DUF1828 domain-containing protein n=1 Tax=Haemophilus haemolyticus TaxID=726 RepID=A0A502LHY6_HAEHA|nr:MULTISPECIES: DUF1828 domain-containing protein [Haemophilus]MDK7281568.1 DUF1828 domain-containing protein [Haemophilus seminalis]TPH23892.1 DUF1828 domain-containing protein [Haemophilus haemolyticus]
MTHCQLAMRNLGFECQALTETLSHILSPFTYVDDGQVVGAFIQSLDNNRFLVTDDASALFNMENRGINITRARFQQMQHTLKRQGIQLTDRAEIIAYATEENLAQSVQNVIRGGIIATTMGIDWYKPMPKDKFEQKIIHSLRKADLPYQIQLKQKIEGLSGHEITVPITLIGANDSKIMFTADVKAEGSWLEAYTILGKLADITQYQNGLGLDQKIVVANSDNIQDKLSQLTLLFNNTAQVYPSHLMDKWLPRLQLAA